MYITYDDSTLTLWREGFYNRVYYNYTYTYIINWCRIHECVSVVLSLLIHTNVLLEPVQHVVNMFADFSTTITYIKNLIQNFFRIIMDCHVILAEKIYSGNRYVLEANYIYSNYFTICLYVALSTMVNFVHIFLRSIQMKSFSPEIIV